MNKRGIAVVHVNNADEILGATKVMEVEPEHIICVSYQLGLNAAMQILEHDPLRKDAIIRTGSTGSVVFCHSDNQAKSVAQRSIAGDTLFNDGAVWGPNVNNTLTSTAPLWAVGLNAASQVFIITTRRGAAR